jgi:hypothetical protein
VKSDLRKSNLRLRAAAERLLAEGGLTKDDIYMKGFYSFDHVTGENIAAIQKRAAKARDPRLRLE